MNDIDATFGKYRATACEWLPKKQCKNPLLPGYCYCEEHKKLAYQPASKKERRAHE